jgi:hypothetical protein
LEGGATEEMVGEVRSIVRVVEAGEFDGGPFVLVSVPKTSFARTCGWSVPSEHPVILRVKLVPEEALGVKVQPVAVPAFEKSDAATALTFCEKERE